MNNYIVKIPVICWEIVRVKADSEELAVEAAADLRSEEYEYDTDLFTAPQVEEEVP